MASVASAANGPPLPSGFETGKDPMTVSSPKLIPRRLSLNNPAELQAFPQAPYSPSNSITGYNYSFTNWNSYNLNKKMIPNYANPNPIPSPPASMSSISANSSTTSSPTEPAATSHAHSPNVDSYFNKSRQRSRSFAVPATTSCCTSCGLRRPSSVSDATLSPSTISASPNHLPRHRPHLPLHLHCPDACPDDHFPTKSGSSPAVIDPSRKRHHRRRSSLCYAESLIEDAEILDNGGVPADVKHNWEKQAESIARRVMLKKTGLEGFKIVEEQAVED